MEIPQNAQDLAQTQIVSSTGKKVISKGEINTRGGKIKETVCKTGEGTEQKIIIQLSIERDNHYLNHSKKT